MSVVCLGFFIEGSDALHTSQETLVVDGNFLQVWLEAASCGDVVMTAEQLSRIALCFLFFTNVACSCHMS